MVGWCRVGGKVVARTVQQTGVGIVNEGSVRHLMRSTGQRRSEANG